MSSPRISAKFIGGILMIVGTSIGGGMLALPVANAATGFWLSSLCLFACWTLMTLGAFFILEVNLYLPPGKNMISMAAATLGRPGLLITWITYLLLLYSLLSAYISGGADMLGYFFETIGFPLYAWQSSLLFTGIFGLITFGGIRPVDLCNRALMFAKLLAYFTLIGCISPHINSHYLQGVDYYASIKTLSLLITSFGFAIIVPNLRDYFRNDLPSLKRILLIGSLIPLICYLAWDAVIMGTVPREGTNGLAMLVHSEHTNSVLATLLSLNVHSSVISRLFEFFSAICVLTAFLGVSLALNSFLADGLNLSKKGRQGAALFLLTFSPPLCLVILWPGIYIHALNYAGFFCIILLLLLPALMAYYGRKQFRPLFTVPGGKKLQIALILVALGLLVNFLLEPHL